MDYRITQPVICSVMRGTLGDDVYVDGKSFELLQEIQKTLSVFEPIGDDEARKLWLEIPRGSAEEWKAFDKMRGGYPDDEEDSVASYREALDEEYPYETMWLFLVTSTYHENTFMKISDRDRRYVIFTNRHSHNDAYPWDMVWLFEPLLKLVKDRVAWIAEDTEAYNRHIAEHVPYRQRSGRIKGKYLNRIVPGRGLEVENRAHCIEVMRELVRREKIYSEVKGGTNADWEGKGVPDPFDTMSIRTFCKYYRIADTVFRSGSDYGRAKNRTAIKDDVEYYSSYALHRKLDGWDLDSVEAFNEFAQDHYGELGLSRMNVGADDYHAGGKWIVTFDISYSAYVGIGLKIAMALYETGAPVVFHNAENLLHILEETGKVRITPFIFHDYLKAGDDEGVFELPYAEDCDKEDELSRAQYDEIVRLAEWEPDSQVKLDKLIPLEDKVYDLIRDEVEAPLTLSGIRHRIEKKYDTYLSVNEEDGYTGYYYMRPMRNKSLTSPESKRYYRTFNEAMRALIEGIKVR